MTTIDQTKLANILPLSMGAHYPGLGATGHCVMEAISEIAGESITDHPTCVAPTLITVGIYINDALPDGPRQRLIAYIPRLIGTRGDGRESLRVRATTEYVGGLMAEYADREWMHVLMTWELLSGRSFSTDIGWATRFTEKVYEVTGEPNVLYGLLDAMLAVSDPPAEPITERADRALVEVGA